MKKIYITEKKDFEGHVNNKTNPHEVTKSQVGLSNVDNTSDVDKPVSTAQQQAISDALSSANEYTDKEIADLINGAPTTLDTLKEIADAMAENEDVVEALESAIGTKANQADLTAHANNADIHVTASDKTNWNNATDKINNLEIGGRNLLLNTANDIINDATNTGNNYEYKTVYTNLEKGETYTLSAEITVEGTEDKRVTILAYNPTTDTDGEQRIMIADGTRQSVTFGMPRETPNLLIYAGVAGATSGVKAILHNAKLEKGNVATDWTPAPEDKIEIADVNGLQTIADNNQFVEFDTSNIGWHRIASYLAGDMGAVIGGSSNSCEIVIKRGFSNTPNEEHRLLLKSIYNNQRFVAISTNSNTEASHIITKIRYVYDNSSRAYIDFYYNANNIGNRIVFLLNDAKDMGSRNWELINSPYLVDETIEGETVSTVFDIPANANPVNTATLETTLANTTQRHYQHTIDLSDTSIYDENTWYPCVGQPLPYAGLRRLEVAVQLNSGTKPSWSTHANGFTCNLDLLIKGYGWGTTDGQSICLQYSCKYVAIENGVINNPCGYHQLYNSSRPVLWLRGGGRYYVYTEYETDWTPETTESVYSEQTIAPTTTAPGVTLDKSTIHANLEGNASTANTSNSLTLQPKLTTPEAVDAFIGSKELKVASVGSYEVGWASSDGMIISVPWENDQFGAQIAIDDQSNFMAFRTRSNNIWNTWVEMLHTGNFADKITPRSIGAPISMKKKYSLGDSDFYVDSNNNITLKIDFNEVISRPSDLYDRIIKICFFTSYSTYNNDGPLSYLDFTLLPHTYDTGNFPDTIVENASYGHSGGVEPEASSVNFSNGVATIVFSNGVAHNWTYAKVSCLIY